MANSHELFVECYEETQKQFPGSQPHVLKSMADRLCNSLLDCNRRRMTKDEIMLRYTQLRTALFTLPEIRGLKSGDNVPDNYK